MLQRLKALVESIRAAFSRPPELLSQAAGAAQEGARRGAAREAAGERKLLRNFELLRLDTLATVRRTGNPAMLAAFQRWQDPAWKRETLSLR